jgi:hypothetical protein
MRLIREFDHQAGLQKLADAQAFTEDKQEQWIGGKTFCYGIWRKPPKEQVGQIQVKNVEWKIPSAELEYFIDTIVSTSGLRDRECSRNPATGFWQTGVPENFWSYPGISTMRASHWRRRSDFGRKDYIDEPSAADWGNWTTYTTCRSLRKIADRALSERQ